MGIFPKRRAPPPPPPFGNPLSKKIWNMQYEIWNMKYEICNIYHVIVHFLPKKHCFWPKKALFFQIYKSFGIWEDPPPPCWERFPNNIVFFFWQRTLVLIGDRIELCSLGHLGHQPKNKNPPLVNHKKSSILWCHHCFAIVSLYIFYIFETLFMSDPFTLSRVHLWFRDQG